MRTRLFASGYFRSILAMLLAAVCACTPASPPAPPETSPFERLQLPTAIFFDGDEYLRVEGEKERPGVVRFVRAKESIESFSTWSKLLLIHVFPAERDPEAMAKQYLESVRKMASIRGDIYDTNAQRTLADYALGMALPGFTSFEVHHLKFFPHDGFVVAYEFIAQKSSKDPRVVEAFVKQEIGKKRDRFRSEIRNARWLL